MLLAGTVDDNDSELSLDSEKKVSLIGDFIFQKQKNAKYHSGKAYLFIFIAFILILLFIAIFGKRNFMKNFFEKLKNGLVNLMIPKITKIIECGPPDELLALKGKYYRLVEIQSMSEKLTAAKAEHHFE